MSRFQGVALAHWTWFASRCEAKFGTDASGEGKKSRQVVKSIPRCRNEKYKPSGA
jgi:hypothetical protein